MSKTTLRYKYDFMRFPMDDESSYELVVRSEKGGEHAYDVYLFKPEMYSYSASVLHYFVDLAQYTPEELVEWLHCWGYTSLESFQDYLANETIVHNYELRLATCITENDFFMNPETLLEGDYDECFEYLRQRLGGRSPLDDTDEAAHEEQTRKSSHDMSLW